jgi:hypothetical protein
MNTCVHNQTARFGVRTAAALLVLGVAAWSSRAAAAPVCFPTPISVPGLTGSPLWYTAPTTGPDSGDAVRTDLNEPRWSASPVTDFGNDVGSSSTSNGGIRVIASSDFTELSVSLQSTAGLGTSSADGAYFGMWVPPAGGTGTGTGVVVKIPLVVASTDPTSISSALWTSFTYSGGTTTTSWSATLGAPSWVQSGSVAAWTNQPVTSGGADWAIQFKVSLTALGIAPTTSFNTFFGLHVTNGTTNVDLVTPKYATTTPTLIPNTIVPVDPTTWYAAPTVSAGCANGVYFNSPMQIGTTNSDSSLISTAAGATNSFFATPVVPQGLLVPPNALQAKFQIANWGAQIADPAAPWTTVMGSPVVNTAAGTATSTAAGTVSFGFSCPTNSTTTTSNGNATDVCGVPPPSGSLGDQCMLVSLSDAPLHPNGTPISTASVYRNMRFGTLSTQVFPANLDIRGLQAITGVAMARDVYVNVVTHNMPALGNLPMILDSALMNLLKSALLGLIAAVDPLAESLSLDAQMKVVWPTYEVHVFYDTGRLNTINGVTYHVLSPMNSFGYYLSHSGLFYGFTSAISGVGGTSLTPVGSSGNTFKVNIPNESFVQIQSGVSADEIPLALVPLADYACELWPWACP